ncbi:MAG: TolC family protein, partial [Planctomycetaceae bacterium]|nr:TolC family protein [Planctomycetaceae bacterium]
MPKAAPANFGFSPKSPPSNSPKSKRKVLPLIASYLLLGTLCGCSVFSSAALSSKDYVVGRACVVKEKLHSKTLHYLGDSELDYYKEVATKIDYTHVGQETDNRAVMTEPPRRIRHPRDDEIVDITLAECIQRALSHSDIIRDRGQFLSPGNTILNASQQANSIYDPAIQETGILLGNRGVEAALADFDTNFTINSLWGRDEQVQNSPFTGQGVQLGRTFIQETANVSAQLQKQLATGATWTLSHTINYQGTNSPPGQRLFPSVYTGNLQAQYRHPLLSGSGVEFNRIAGPSNSNPLRISGVNQGVVIARINEDISIADFEASVRNLLKDVEDLYWELGLAYRAYDAEVVARNSNLHVWRITKNNTETAGRLTRADVADAEETFFETRSRSEEALAQVYSIEAELRRLMGMPVNDGYILRPVDEPSTAEFLPDWHMSLAEALTNRVELRRQKWLIKSLELQLKAARTLVRPR